MTFIPPKSKMVNFVATGDFSLIEPAVSSGNFMFLALNNPYDVLTAVGGPSPMGFAAMSTYFNKYRCDRARVRIEGFTFGAANGMTEVCLVPCPTYSTLPSNPRNWRDAFRSACDMVLNTNSASGARKAVLDRQWNMWDLFGVSRGKYVAEDNYGAVYNGSPVNTMYAAITVFGLIGGTEAQFRGKYTVSFDVLFYSPTAQNP